MSLSPEALQAQLDALNCCRFVIDGTNVLLLHGRANPELRYVLALCEHFRASGESFLCFFDANTAHILGEYAADQRAVFEAAFAEPRWADRLFVVPSGMEADEWILRRAKADGADVISNDKFRSRARDHRWIWKRRHGLVGARECLTLPSLGLAIPV